MPDVFVAPKKDKTSLSDEKTRPKLSKSSILSPFKQAFSSYLHLPSGIRFETQGDQEIIILFLRRHFVTNFTWVASGVLLILFPIVLFPVIVSSGLVPFDIPNSLLTFLILAWYLFTFSYILVNFLLWYFDLSIVTNERIVDIDFANILHKEISATTLSRVEDITSRRGGFVRVLFDYGDVFIQTAGSTPEFEFLGIPSPEKVVKIINELMNGG